MKKKLVSIVLFLVMAGVLVACGNESSGGQSENSSTQNTEEASEYVDVNGYLKDDSVYVVGVEKLPYSHEEIYTQLFDLCNRVEVEIDISDEELAKIQKDYETYRDKGSKSPIYRDGALNIRISNTTGTYTYHIPNVGIRMKGNTSRTDFYSSKEGQYNLIHYRIKFRDADFATLESLELKWNRNDDQTYIREYYAYEMYRDLGILAPRTNLASMDVAGVHQGVFTIYEPVDKNFIKRYVAKEDQGGDLYKCAWTRNGASLTLNCSVGIEDEENSKFYNYDLKTNKKTSDHSRMKNLLRVLNKSDLTEKELEEVVDIDSFLRFAAISYFVGNPDDIRYNYNNHYIYFLKSSGKAVFIPYDCDRVLGVTYGWNPTGDGMTTVSPYSDKADSSNEPQKNPLFNFTVGQNGKYLGEYTTELKQVAASNWLKPETFEGYYAIASRNYSAYTKPEKTFYNAEHHAFTFNINASAGLNTNYGNSTFAEYVKAKLESFHGYLEN